MLCKQIKLFGTTLWMLVDVYIAYLKFNFSFVQKFFFFLIVYPLSCALTLPPSSAA